MLAGERLHNEATLHKIAGDKQVVRGAVPQEHLTPDFQHFHGSGANFSTKSASSAETTDVGFRLHEWAAKASRTRGPSEERTAAGEKSTAGLSTSQSWLENGYNKAAEKTQKRLQQEEMAAKSTFVPDLEQFRTSSSLAKSDGDGEKIAVGDRLYRSAEQKKKAMDEKRQAQEQKMLEDLAQMGKPTISKKAQALERGEDEQPYYQRAIISERRRPPDATGMQTMLIPS